MDKYETAGDSPPAYNDIVGASTSPHYPPPPPYPLPGPQQLSPPSTPQSAYLAPLLQQPSPQQQQQQVVLVNAGQAHPVTVQIVQSFVGHIVFACIVFWFCNWIFGLIAFILAVTASSAAVSDPQQARKLGRASIGLSVTGIVISGSVVVVIVLLSRCTQASQATSCHDYSYEGSCYRYRTHVGSPRLCVNGVKSSNGYCYYDSCPYHEYNGACYYYKTYVGSSRYCSGVRSSSGYCYMNYCSDYQYKGSCYKYRKNVGSYETCNGVRSYSYCYYVSCPNYQYLGTCYKYTEYVGSSAFCGGVRSSDNYCYYTSCSSGMHEYGGSCYKYRKYVGSSGPCTGVRSSTGMYCYYTSCPGYTYLGLCYETRTYVGSGYCSGVRSSVYCYSNPYY